MKFQWYVYLILICCYSCCEHNTNDYYFIKSDFYLEYNNEKKNHQSILERRTDSTYESIGLIDIKKIDSSILVDLKYTKSNNAFGQTLYKKIKKAYVQKEVAMKLLKAHDFLKSIEPGYRLIIYDAVRPVEVQKVMWNLMDTIPIVQRVNFVSNPLNGSLHNFGAAVDITIVNNSKVPIDMGANYDDPRKIAYPILEKEFQRNGLLTQYQIDNRMLLRKVMRQAGFTQLKTEWWHFNSCTRQYALNHYKVLKKEF